MAEARDQAQWNHTSAVLAQVQNSTCTRRSDLIDPMSFNPWRHSRNARQAAPMTESDRELLKSLFQAGRGRPG